MMIKTTNDLLSFCLSQTAPQLQNFQILKQVQVGPGHTNEGKHLLT